MHYGIVENKTFYQSPPFKQVNIHLSETGDGIVIIVAKPDEPSTANNPYPKTTNPNQVIFNNTISPGMFINPNSIRLSPDGKHVAYLASRDVPIPNKKPGTYGSTTRKQYIALDNHFSLLKGKNTGATQIMQVFVNDGKPFLLCQVYDENSQKGLQVIDSKGKITTGPFGNLGQHTPTI